MSTAAKSARLVPVSEQAGPPNPEELHPRARALVEELRRLSIDPAEMTESEVKDVLNIDPVTWKRMQVARSAWPHGQYVRPSSFTRAEAGLAAHIEEHGLQAEERPAVGGPSPETIEYEIEGYRGVGFKTFRVKGPVADARQMEESVIRILTRLQRLEHEAEKPTD